MGLLYLFPVSLEENDYASVSGDTTRSELTLNTYGLPGIFWFYLLSILGVIFVMFFLIKNSIYALVKTNDPLNVFLGQLVLYSLGIVPLGLLSFFFFQKNLKKRHSQLQIRKRIFGLPIYKKNYILRTSEPLTIKHFMNSPNLVRLKDDKKMQTYMNRGYFELWGHDQNDRPFLIDRHSRKADLIQLKDLLEKF